MLAGIDTVHIPYKGSTPILVDLMGGRVDMAFIGISGSIPASQGWAGPGDRHQHAQALAQLPGDSCGQRDSSRGFELNSWYGMMAPAGTPKPIVTRLQQELAAALRKPDVIDWMKQNGLDPVGSTPEEHAAHIRAELAKWAKIVKDAKVTAN